MDTYKTYTMLQETKKILHMIAQTIIKFSEVFINQQIAEERKEIKHFEKNNLRNVK